MNSQNTDTLEDYIANESPELRIGESQTWPKKLLTAFPAFRHKNFTLYFSAQLISFSGTWVQSVAQGLLILEITRSPLWLGIITGLSSLPILIFSLPGGVLVDRFPKKKILLLTQLGLFFLTFILGVLTISHLITVPQICLLVFLIGIITAIDTPARQSFIIELVGKKDLSSAIALNAGSYNSARVIGPSIAGFLIAGVGIGFAFIVNAVSFLAVFFALRHMQVKKDLIEKIDQHPFTAIKEGILYAFSHTIIKKLLFMITIISVFGWSYTTILPVVVVNIFHMGALALGTFFASAGIGAVLATIVLSVYSKKINPFTFIMIGSAIFALSLFIFTFSNNFFLSTLLLFFSGFGLIIQTATINSTIQHHVEDTMRGRVMSIFTLMFIGMSPLGSFQVGFVAQHFGAFSAIQIGAFFSACVGIFIYFSRKKLFQDLENALK